MNFDPLGAAPAKFYLRFVYLDGEPMEGVVVTDIGGPYAERGEAEEVASWLNGRAQNRVFYYVSTRSALEP